MVEAKCNVISKIPCTSKKCSYTIDVVGRLAQLVRAARLHRVGQGFESLGAHQNNNEKRAARLHRVGQGFEPVLSFSKHPLAPTRIIWIRKQKNMWSMYSEILKEFCTKGTRLHCHTDSNNIVQRMGFDHACTEEGRRHLCMEENLIIVRVHYVEKSFQIRSRTSMAEKMI